MTRDLLDAVGAIVVLLLRAVSDGHVDAVEAGSIYTAAVAELGGLAGGPDGVIAWVTELLRRDPARMRETAARLASEGHDRRAARLVERAGRIERERADPQP